MCYTIDIDYPMLILLVSVIILCFHNDNTYILVIVLSLMVKVHRINEVEYSSHNLQAIPHAII
jgi:hypothetical protein